MMEPYERRADIYELRETFRALRSQSRECRASARETCEHVRVTRRESHSLLSERRMLRQDLAHRNMG
jgi:uncharacterized coiled-coil DUF342 family protein